MAHAYLRAEQRACLPSRPDTKFTSAFILCEVGWEIWTKIATYDATCDALTAGSADGFGRQIDRRLPNESRMTSSFVSTSESREMPNVLLADKKETLGKEGIAQAVAIERNFSGISFVTAKPDAKLSLPSGNSRVSGQPSQGPVEWRRGWDSNPRGLSPCRFSRPEPSTTRPPLPKRRPAAALVG